MKVIILGSKGMLGKYVWSYLDLAGFDCVGVNKDSLDAATATEEKLEEVFFKEIKLIEKGDVVINCMGTIKPRVDSLGDLNAIQVNSVFPRLLANFCEKHGLNLIHPTTDCVYTGLKGSYNENDKYDVSDVYGMSKAMGEPNNCTVIRTSIIGEEVNQGRSLVEWVKSSANTTINGFTNHYWNGITTLEWAKVAEALINLDMEEAAFIQPTIKTLSKYEVLGLIKEVFTPDSKTVISAVESEKFQNKSLASNAQVNSIKDQLVELKEWYDLTKV